MNESKAVSQAAEAARRERLCQGAIHPWQETGLALIRGLGEAGDCQIYSFPVRRIMQDPPLRRVFAYGSVSCGLAQMEPCAQRIPRAA
jgi:hypothetical protein